MKCIVTGGSGFIGSHLVQYLLKNNHDITVIDKQKPIQDVNWIDKDIRDSLNKILKGADIIFHLAAIANARKCGEDPKLCFSTNVGGTQNILSSALNAGVERVILASSIWVSGSQIGDVVNEESPFDVKNITTIYEAAKLSQEMLCYSYLNEEGGPDYTILRYGIPYGERMWKGLVVRAFMSMAENHGIINIMGDGKQSRPFLHVEDLCRAHLLALKPIARNKIYNLGGTQMISIEELGHEVIKYFPARINFIPQTRIEPKIKTISSWLAETELEWIPNITLENGIQYCAKWWKSISKVKKNEEYWC